MLKLIVNADDFGLTRGCNEGILEAYNNGIVTDTTILINGKYADEAIKMARENGIERMGLHLNLTSGFSVLPPDEIPSLINENGRFYNRVKYLLPVVNLKDAEKELRAQIEKFYKTGIGLTHLDCHHHLHMYEGLSDIVIALASELKVPLRHTDVEKKNIIRNAGICTTDYFTMEFYGEKSGFDGLKNILNRFDNGVLEIMSHPGKVDSELMVTSSYNIYRQKELETLVSDETKDYIRERGIELIQYDLLR